MPQELQALIEQYPELVYALIQLMQNMNEEELAKFAQAIAQMAQAKMQGQGGGGQEPQQAPPEDPRQAEANLFG